MLRASFDVVTVTGPTLFIRDRSNQDATKSVTNDAEEVVKWCLRKYPGRRIVYQDTDRRWDELLHDGEKFAGFRPWRGWVPG